MSFVKSSIPWALAALLMSTACAPREEAPAPEVEEPAMVEEAAPEAPMVREAEAVLVDALGESVGNVKFSQAGDSAPVMLVAAVESVPAGLHGLHLHEKGECAPPDFKSARGHFNPTEAPHGGPDDAERHAGDFGNITVGEFGTGQLKLETDMLTLVENMPNTAIGRAVILHEKADDLVSQPTGAAGGRLACGIVEPVAQM